MIPIALNICTRLVPSQGHMASHSLPLHMGWMTNVWRKVSSCPSPQPWAQQCIWRDHLASIRAKQLKHLSEAAYRHLARGYQIHQRLSDIGRPWPYLGVPKGKAMASSGQLGKLLMNPCFYPRSAYCSLARVLHEVSGELAIAATNMYTALLMDRNCYER